MSKALLLLLLGSVTAAAQLIPAGTAVPKGSKPPVVFLNGYQGACTANAFADNFGKFDQFLQTAGRVSVYFDNCAYPGKPSIESLGASFGAYLSSLRYTDSTPVTQVDVVAHSMGGLIVRAYLAGIQADGTFAPPAGPIIRKAIFLATPHFGTASFPGNDVQVQEMAAGSAFVYSLATWNQGTDDLRGVDVLGIAGNGGLFLLNGSPVGDGIVNLTSVSAGFAVPGRTRVLPYCHIPYAALQTLFTNAGQFTGASSACPPNAAGIANGLSAADANVAMVVSFLNDTPDWLTIGTAAEQNPVLSTEAGVLVRAQSAAGEPLLVNSASAGQTLLSNGMNNAVAYNPFILPGLQTVTVDSTGGLLTQQVNAAGGYSNALLIKPGPHIARVFPAAAAVAPLSLAPGTIVSIYGTNLAPSPVQASTTPLPTSLGGTQVLVSGVAIPLLIVTPNQINAILPDSLAGARLGSLGPPLATLSVTGTNGQHTVNIIEAPAVPALFTQNSGGTGLASVLNAVTNVPVSPAAPLHAGDYAAIYLTGLGAKTQSGVATIQPTVSIGGQPCPVQYAGSAPGFVGLDQINCQIPPGLGSNSAAPLVVTSNGRASNTATVILQ